MNFGLLSNLNTLTLDNNALTEFPKVICALSLLAKLNISCNRIRAIPNDIGKLTTLEVSNFVLVIVLFNFPNLMLLLYVCLLFLHFLHKRKYKYKLNKYLIPIPNPAYRHNIRSYLFIK